MSETNGRFHGEPAGGYLHLTPAQVHTTFSAPLTGATVERSEERRYLPTLADLIDRLSIVQMKAVFISERREEYMKERRDLEHDINLIIRQRNIIFDAEALHAIMIIMLANRYIWENEAQIRDGSARLSDAEFAKRMRATHSINGVRNTAKNQLSRVDGGRMDYKIDCFAAELEKDLGNWNVFA